MIGSFFSQRKVAIAIFLLILIGGFVIRLYRFNGPIADWHAWRQADTSAVSRNFVANGFDLLYPKFDDISNVPSKIDNPEGYRFVEFPTFNIFQAGFYLLFGHLTLEEWGRIVTIVSTLLSSAFIFLLMKKFASTFSAFFAMFFYTFFPFTIYYGRTILPDQSMVATILAGLYFFSLFVDSKKFQTRIFFWVIAAIFFALALLFKPFAGFFFLPAIWISWKKWDKKFIFRGELWAMLICVLVPFVLWRIWMSSHPEGIPQSAWLFNDGNIRFTGAFFQWIFAKRIGGIILGYWGLPILVLGLIVRQKNKAFFLCSIFSFFIYVSIIARGNVQHDYYQLPVIPVLAMLCGIGSEFLLHPPKEFIAKYISCTTFIICCLFMFAFSWYEVRDFFNINNPSIVIAGQAVNTLTPKNAKIIAPLDGDTSFLYQTNRKGWASFEKPLDEMIKMGANYLVLIDPKQQDYSIGKKYKIVSSTKDYILFNLNERL